MIIIMISTGYTKKMIHFSKRCEEERECISRQIIFLSYTSSSLIISSFLLFFFIIFPEWWRKRRESSFHFPSTSIVLPYIFSLSLFLPVLFFFCFSPCTLIIEILRSTQNKVFTIPTLSILLTIISLSDDIKILTVRWMDEKLIRRSKMYYSVNIL